VFFMAYPPNWKSGIAMSAFVGCAITLVAYMYTPFIKLRGRTYAFYTADRSAGSPRDRGEPPPGQAVANRATASYGGGVSVKKSWWLATVGVGILALSVFADVISHGNAWLTASLASAIVVIAVVFGYRDAILRQPVASGQRVQFGLLSAITLGAFTVSYLGAYYASKRWLVERQEYGRHQRKIR
jgi:hypothetical protein